MKTDAQLIKEARTNADAFAELYERHVRSVEHRDHGAVIEPVEQIGAGEGPAGAVHRADRHVGEHRQHH